MPILVALLLIFVGGVGQSFCLGSCRARRSDGVRGWGC